MKKYPEGGEKQLIDAVMHRQVKSGGLPIDVGAVVQNVATALAVYDAVQKNKPLIDNSVTVTGECFPKQANLLVRVGTPLRYIIDYLGGVPENAAKIISGGPMMGKAIANLDAATLKRNGSLALPHRRTDQETSGKAIASVAESAPTPVLWDWNRSCSIVSPRSATRTSLRPTLFRIASSADAVFTPVLPTSRCWTSSAWQEVRLWE